MCFVFLPMKDIPINMSHSNVIGIHNSRCVYRELSLKFWMKNVEKSYFNLYAYILCIIRRVTVSKTKRIYLDVRGFSACKSNGLYLNQRILNIINEGKSNWSLLVQVTFKKKNIYASQNRLSFSAMKRRKWDNSESWRSSFLLVHG